MFKPKEERKLRQTIEQLATETNRLARTVERIEIKQKWSVYAHPWKFLLFSFLNGLFIAIGSTVGIILVIYLLRVLGYLPFICNSFNNLKDTLIEAGNTIR